MEAIKKILSPGSSKDDAAAYSNTNTGSATGGDSKLTGGSHSTHTGSTGTGYDSGLNTQSTNTESKLGHGVPGNTSTTHGTSSHLPGTDNSRQTGSAVPSHLSGPSDDAASTASIRSGVVGADQPSGAHHGTGLGSGTTGSSGVQHQEGLGHESLHQHAGPGHRFEHTLEKETPVPGYVHHTQGPHATDTANRLDPHVPGEFPSATGNDIHSGSHNQSGAGLAGGALGGAVALGSHQHEKSQHESPLGRTAGFEDQRFDPTSRSQHGTEGQSIGYPSSTSNTTGLSEHPRDDHHGRNAALGGTAAGLGGAGAYEATRHSGSAQQDPSNLGAGSYGSTSRAGPTSQDPASYTTGPHKSNVANIVDPRVRPEPEKMKDHTTAGPHASDTLNRADPKVDSDLSNQGKDHHYGRDAALAGGAGAAGVGAYEATRGSHPTDQTSSSHFNNSQPQGSTLTSGSHQNATSATPGLSNTSNDHHYGRDAALGGGAGAAGVGAYEATRGSHPTDQTYSQSQGNTLSSGSHQTDPRGTSDLSKSDKDHHYGRDAALVGGAGAAGAAAYGATRSDRSEGLAAPQSSSQPLTTPTGAPHDARIFDQTQNVPDSKQVSGGWAADTKAQEKLQKERAKEAEKSHHKAEKAHDKSVKEHAKEAEKAHEQPSEKKHGILGFLHRDKSEPKDTADETTLNQQGNLREADQAAHIQHQRELEQRAAAGGGIAGASFEPPLKEQLQHSEGSSSHRELDDRSREQGVLGGATSGTTGTTGTTGHHATGTTGTTGNDDGIVIEPRTGLPMNVGKYGSGTGGTDGSSTIPGFHNNQI